MTLDVVELTKELVAIESETQHKNQIASANHRFRQTSCSHKQFGANNGC